MPSETESATQSGLEKREMLPKLRLLQIEPTTRCNLDCIYCARRRLLEGGEIEKGDISTERVLVALNKLSGRVETVLYQGWGEPMLCRDLPELLEMAHEIGAKTTIVTNGTVFRPEVFDRCDSITISIDSLRPEYNTRKGSNPIKIKENIIKIRENYPDLPISLSMVVSQENIDDLEQIINFAKQVRARVRLLSQIGEALPPINEADIKKIESLVALYPGFVEWSRPEELHTNKEHPQLKNSLYVDIGGQVSIPYHETSVRLGRIEELDKITDQLIKKDEEAKLAGNL